MQHKVLNLDLTFSSLDVRVDWLVASVLMTLGISSELHSFPRLDRFFVDNVHAPSKTASARPT